MNNRMSRRAGAAAPIRLVEKRSDQPVDAPPERAERNSLEEFVASVVASVAARWRGHEPEIAIMGTVTLILAIAAVFAGADILFTLLATLVAAITIWSPWREPRR
jgi:hypothetical protein